MILRKRPRRFHRTRRLLGAGLAIACLGSSAGIAGLKTSYKPLNATAAQGELIYQSDSDYVHASFFLKRDRIEILHPTDRTLPVLVWANGWSYRLSPGFSRDWLLGRLKARDQQILRSIQARLDDAPAVGLGLETALDREIRQRYGHLDPQGRDICEPEVHGGLFAAYGVSVIGTAVSCALAASGIGAAICGAGIAGAVGGAIGLIISDQACNPQGGADDSPGDGGDGGDDGDDDRPGDDDPFPPECPVDVDPGECVCIPPDDCVW